jgi:hypothetical protein
MDIYDGAGSEINPIPENVKITVWISDGGDNEGFAVDVNRDDLGLEELIAKKWILQSDLDLLLTNKQQDI